MEMQIKSGVSSRQLLRNMLVEDFLYGQGDDDFVGALEERFDLRQRIRRIIERHEEDRLEACPTLAAVFLP
jgi:hypothetical protein